MDAVRRALDGLEAATGVFIGLTAVAGAGRSADHAAGREAVHLAFVRAGAVVGDIGREDDGRPRWPDGWTGSVAHGDGLAVAAVAPLRTHRAAGIDVERAGALPPDDAAMVLGVGERRWIAAEPDAAAAATLLWSAKEAAFKAWATAAGGLEGVDPVDITVRASPAGTLTAEATGPLAVRVRGPLTGAFAEAAGRVVTLVVDPSTP